MTQAVGNKQETESEAADRRARDLVLAQLTKSTKAFDRVLAEFEKEDDAMREAAQVLRVLSADVATALMQAGLGDAERAVDTLRSRVANRLAL